MFAGSHCGRILAALARGAGTAHDIAGRTGLTVVQIDRRLPELERDGKVRVQREAGEPVVRDGFRVWEIAG